MTPVFRKIYMSTDGLTLFATRYDTHSIHEFSLATSWDLLDFTFVATYTFNLADTLFFKSDGSMMYLHQANTAIIDQYVLDPAWDISSATLIDTFTTINTQNRGVGFTLSHDGLKLYTTDIDIAGIMVYKLGTAWAISTAVPMGPELDLTGLKCSAELNCVAAENVFGKAILEGEIL